VRFPPANIELRRAQLILMLVVLIPTILTTLVGIALLMFGGGTTAVVAGILVLTMCTTGITGYILVSVFVGKGASLVRMQNDFLSSVSHELRTPLTSMRLLMESLRGNRLDPGEQDKVVTLLSGEIDRLDELVLRVLELSRLETRRHPVRRDRVVVADVVRDAIAAFDAATLSRPTPIEFDVEPGLTMLGDRATLARAIANLLTNAWKYTGDDKRITVVARGAGRHVEIAVRDNGIGIEPGEQREIFEEFHRAPGAISRGTHGFGLGLAFVRAIARAHRGKVEVSSRPGAGSEFRLRLRRGRPEGAPDPAPVAAPDAAPAAPTATAAAPSRPATR
jgi:two-component system, OmpR family, phosphate regulon sensor histidine kinase PhoR